MARRKSELFDDELVELADFAKSLSHPARIAILRFLINNQGATCGKIVDAIPLAQPTVSQHLRVLVTMGVLKSREVGPSVCYTVNVNTVQVFCERFKKMIS